MRRRRPVRQNINEQLHIGVPSNPNIPSRYARGLFSMQPQLGVEDWSLDFYNDIDSLGNMSNASGDDWGSGNFSNAGGYGLFCGRKCVAEKQAAGIPPKRSGRKGKHDAAFEATQQQQAAQQQSVTTGGKGSSSSSGGGEKSGMSTGAKVGIAVGAVVVLGLVGYLVMRKR